MSLLVGISHDCWTEKGRYLYDSRFLVQEQALESKAVVNDLMYNFIMTPIAHRTYIYIDIWRLEELSCSATYGN